MLGGGFGNPHAQRERLDLTQGQFAARLSQRMSGPAVSRWESGRGAPSPLYVEKLDELRGKRPRAQGKENENANYN